MREPGRIPRFKHIKEPQSDLNLKGKTKIIISPERGGGLCKNNRKKVSQKKMIARGEKGARA